MYVPSRYKESDLAVLKDFMRENDFATLITWDGGALQATHLLVAIEENPQGKLLISGHMARANKQWKGFSTEHDALIIFSGAHTYISPTWYNHVNVPTWNYMTIHAYGKPQTVEETEKVYGILKNLVDRYEAKAGKYKIESLPKDYLEKDMKAVMAFQMEVTHLESSFKLSQNRDDEDHANIVSELEKRPDENSHKVASAMRARRK